MLTDKREAWRTDCEKDRLTEGGLKPGITDLWALVMVNIIVINAVVVFSSNVINFVVVIVTVKL